MSGDIAIVAGVIVAFALISRRIGPTIISGPMVFVAAGLLFGPEVADMVDLGLELEAVDIIGEATLAVLLFSDASRIDTRALRREYMLPARLLGIGLPLTIVLGTGMLMVLIDGVGVWEAALIAAILAPTDAALGQEVVTDPAVPARIRQGLNVESGLNDGLVVPAVALFSVLAADDGDTGSPGFWVRFVVEQIGVGMLVGVLVGGIGAWLLTTGEKANWVDGVYAQLATFALAIAALATSLQFDGNGFIAAFVAGMVFGRVAPRAHQLGEFTEDTAQLAAAVSFFIFGNILLGPALDNVSIGIIVCALGALTLVRIVPVAVALAASGAAKETVAFIGWFGPRGLASILFGLQLLEEDIARADDLFAVVAWTVLLSVVLHGATAAVGAKRYGAWWAEMTTDERDSMPEGVEVTHHPVRRWLRNNSD